MKKFKAWLETFSGPLITRERDAIATGIELDPRPHMKGGVSLKGWHNSDTGKKEIAIWLESSDGFHADRLLGSVYFNKQNKVVFRRGK